MTESITVAVVTLPNGETYGYRRRGSGPRNVLLVHGNMTSSKHMELLMGTFDPEAYTVVAVDMRGFGLSSYRKPIDSLKDLSDDLRLFCDAIGFRGFGVLGWSTGGGVAMQLIADHPGYADRLVLMSSMSTRGYPFYALNDNMEPLPERRLKTKEEIAAQARNRMVQDIFDNRDKATLRAIWEAAIYTHNRPPEPLYDEYMDDILTQRNIMDIYHCLNTFNISEINNEASEGSGAVKRVDVPVMIVWGRRDYVISQEMTLELMADLPHARVLWLEDCGHSPMIDQLARLSAATRDFMA